MENNDKNGDAVPVEQTVYSNAKGNPIYFETDRIAVKPRIGLLGCIAFIMGSVIGSGIFISPKGALENSGSYGMSLVIWTLCGVFSFILAMVYAELGVIMPKSGGDYTIIRVAIGSIPAFLVTYVQTVVSQAGSRAVLALVFADYMCAPIFGNCGPPNYIRKAIAALFILNLSISNGISVRFASSIQVLFTLLKTLALVMITVGGLVYLVQGKTENFDNSFEGTTDNPTSIALAVYSCMWAYGGYNNLNEIAEEIINPKKNIPKALIISMSVITAIYLTTNVSYFTMLSKSEFLSVSAVAFEWGERVLGSAAIIIPICVMCSVYGASNGGFFTDVRVRFAAARAGHLPEVFSFLHHSSRIPLGSLVFNTSVALIFLIPGNINDLINLTSFMGFLINGLTVCSLLTLKYKRRNLKKDKDAFSVPIVVPIIALLLCIYMLVAPFLSKPKIEFLYGIGFIASGFIFYVPFVHFSLALPGFDAFTKYSQLLLQIAPTVLEE